MTEIKHQRREDARPEEIIDAAMAEFAVHGFAATRMAGIAARAGISRPTVYLYFATKDAIFEAAVAARLGTMVAARKISWRSTHLLRRCWNRFYAITTTGSWARMLAS